MEGWGFLNMCAEAWWGFLNRCVEAWPYWGVMLWGEVLVDLGHAFGGR